MKQEYFRGAVALTYFVENCLDLPYQYLRNEGISKVLFLLFPKIKQFTCDKMFCSDGYISLKPVQIYFYSKKKHAYLKPNKSEMETNFRAETNLKNTVTNTALQSRSNVRQCILECKYPSF